MCNLNVFVKADELTGEGLLNYMGFIVASTSNSYVGNDDGDGMYFNGTDLLVKSAKKVNPLLYLDDVKTSSITLTHQRISTSGKTEEYTQPFEDEEFVLAHNGVLSEFVSSENEHSDTYNLFEKFKETFKSITSGDRMDKIRKSIQTIFDGQYGSYSIFIYDKTEKRLYYFKNRSTSIYLNMNKPRTMAYMTTDRDNNKMLSIIKEDFTEYEIDDHRIYIIEVLKDKKTRPYVSIRKIGKIKDYVYQKSEWNGWNEKDEVNEYNKSYNVYNKSQDRTQEVQDDVDKLLEEYKNESFYDKYDKKKGQNADTAGSDTLIRNKTEEDIAKYLGLGYDKVGDYCYKCARLTHINDEKTSFFVCKDCIKDDWSSILDLIYLYTKRLFPQEDHLAEYQTAKKKIDEINKEVSKIISKYIE